MMRLLGSLAGILVGPRAAFADMGARQPLFSPALALGVTTALLAATHARRLQALIEAELDLETAGAALPVGAVVALVIVAAPFAVVARALVLGAFLHAASRLVGVRRSTWKAHASVAAHLEVVFVLEVACTAILLHLNPPESLAEIGTTRVRAGLDLVWQPASEAVTAILAAANAFTVWWAVLLAIGLAHLHATPARRTLPVVVPAWFAIITLRYLLQSG